MCGLALPLNVTSGDSQLHQRKQCHMKASGTTWNFLSSGLLLQCCLYLLFVTHFVYHSCVFCSIVYCACVCLLYKDIQNENCYFIATFPCHELLACLWPPSFQFWQLNVTNECILQHEDCSHTKHIMSALIKQNTYLRKLSEQQLPI